MKQVILLKLINLKVANGNKKDACAMNCLKTADYIDLFYTTLSEFPGYYQQILIEFNKIFFLILFLKKAFSY